MQLCVLVEQSGQGDWRDKKEQFMHDFPDGVWVLQLIVHCSDQSVWRWIRKARFLMGSLICLFSLGGHTENLSLSPGAVVGRCPIFSPWTQRSHVLLAEGNLWFGELWFLIWNIEYRNSSCFFSTWENTYKYFILYWCKQWWQLFVVSLHRCQTNIEIWGIEIQFGWAGSTPGSPESSEFTVFAEIFKKKTHLNHNFSWDAKSLKVLVSL